MKLQLSVMNPLPLALAHYERELLETLARVGIEADALPGRPVEGFPGVVGKARMLVNAAANERLSRRAGTTVVTTWPSLGLFDAALASARRNPRVVVLHDPVPLRSQVGFGRVARACARRARKSSRPAILVHSEAAHHEASRLLPHHTLVRALHPMLSAGPVATSPRDPVVLVAGQYKPARDLALLAAIGPRLRLRGLRPRIVGRGWPQIDGWETDSRFVPELELDALLASASMVLLPYSHYFQSGVAVRALENGTPTVGARTGFLADLLGRDFAGLVDSDQPDAYVEHAERVAGLAPKDLIGVFETAQARVDDSWRLLADTWGESHAV